MNTNTKKMTTIGKIQLIVFLCTSILFVYCLINIFICLSTKSNNSKLSVKDTFMPWLISPTNIEVDSQERIYLSTYYHIIVLDSNGEFLWSYQAETTGSYLFKVDSNDNIIIGLIRENMEYTYNQEGEIIDEFEHQEIWWIKEFPESHITTAKSGNVYQYSNWFGYTRIVKISDGEKEVVYRIPFNLFLLKCSLPLIFLGYFASIALLVFRTIPKEQKETLKKYLRYFKK